MKSGVNTVGKRPIRPELHDNHVKSDPRVTSRTHRSCSDSEPGHFKVRSAYVAADSTAGQRLYVA